MAKTLTIPKTPAAKTSPAEKRAIAGKRASAARSVSPAGEKKLAHADVDRSILQSTREVGRIVEAMPAAPTLAFTLIEGYRPTAGGRLFAHTMAVFQLTGLLDGKPAPSSTLSRALGNTAMNYHSGKFVTTAEGKALTPAGLAFFNARGANKEWQARFVSVLATGKPDGDMVKNEAGIKAIGK